MAMNAPEYIRCESSKGSLWWRPWCEAAGSLSHFFFLPLAPAAAFPGFLRAGLAPAFLVAFLATAPAFGFLALPAVAAPASSS